jgi:hypothetical protein
VNEPGSKTDATKEDLQDLEIYEREADDDLELLQRKKLDL